MMATSENGTDISNDIDIDALIMPDVNESEVSAVVDSLQQELTGAASGSLPPQDSSQASEGADQSQNQTTDDTVDLTKTIKTEGESSNLTKASTSDQLTLNLTSTVTTGDSSRRQSLSLMSPFSGIAPQTPLTPNSQMITGEEQGAIHKQAGLLAIHTYCAKHGQAKAKEILDGVTKVKNFLTNLIQLASKSGSQVHSSVHSLVQKLVGGAINENEFATKIEEVLKSKHQPGLLPFLKTSIPDLRQHILLQKNIMKQLIEKKVAEKRGLLENPPQAAAAHQPASTNQSTPSPNQSTPSSNQPTPPPTDKATHSHAPNARPSSTPTPPLPLPSSNPTPSILSTFTLSPQQQQLLKQHLSKLPEPQQKIYLEQIKKEFEKQRKAQIQQLLLQKQQLSGKQSAVNSSVTTAMTSQQQQQLSVLMKQQELIRQQQQQATLSLGNQAATAAQIGSGSSNSSSNSPKKGSSALQARKPLSSLASKKDDDQSPARNKTQDNEEDDEEGMDIAGVNLKEESAHFLPTVSEGVSRSVTDRTLLDSSLLRERMMVTARLHGISDVSEEAVVYVSHALEERLRNVMDKLTVVNRHRTESLKDDSRYQVTSDVRGQLKVLGKIDQISASRREEKEKEMIFKIAKSRAKQDDPEVAKKKEQAKQIQLAQEREIHQKAANETALAAIGRRKRTATAAFGDTPVSSTAVADTEQSSSSTKSSSAAVAAVFSTPGPSRTKQKRKVQAKDVIFVMEQEKETKKSLLLYKSLLN